MRGKAGGFVFRVLAGVGQVMSEYNPEPTNPRTLAQTKQRAKMNLAGQLSKVTPYAAIAGLSTNRRMARSMFVSNLLTNITNTDGANGAIKTTLDYDKVVMSEGAVVPMIPVVSMGANNATISVSFGDVTGITNLLGAIVVCYISTDDVLHSCNVKAVSDLSTPVTFDVATFYQNPMHGGVGVVYVIPIIDNGGDASVAFNQLVLASETNQGQFQSGAVRTLAASEAYGQSIAPAYAAWE